jgi:hypothetical protein
MKAPDNPHHLLKNASFDRRLFFVNHIVGMIPSHRPRLLPYCPCFGFKIGTVASLGTTFARTLRIISR